MMRGLLFVAVLAASTGTAWAQDPVSFVPFENTARDIRTVTATGTTRVTEISSFLAENAREFALYALGREVYSSLVEQGRIDKQLGASSSAPGSTTLVSRGSVPTLIGVAVESGALFQSVNGNAVTFRLNPSGLARALAGRSYLLSAPPLDATVIEDALNRVSVSASFDLQQGSSPGAFTGERSQLQEATVRFNAINRRDPRHPSHLAAIQQLGANLSGVVAETQVYFDVLTKLPDFATWRAAAARRLAGVEAGNDAALRDALFAVGDEYLRTVAVNPDLQRHANGIVAEIRSYRRTRDAVFQAIGKSSVLTFEYAFNRLNLPEAARTALPAGTTLPDLSTARVIFASALGGIGEATVNGSVTLFNTTFARMEGALRDVQVGGSLEFKLPEIEGVGRLVLTFAGLGAFLKQQPYGVPVRIQDIETTDGAIGVFQTRLSMPAGASGVSIPLSLTVANRSEFNTEGEVRGAVGLTFDFDTLFAR